MNRRETMLALAALGAAPRAAKAQQAARVPRIGYLASNLAGSGPMHLVEAFRQGLRDLGYVEGRNVAIVYSDAQGKLDTLPARAAELVALKVDVIFAPGTQHALAAQRATQTIPIVFADVADPVARGLVASLARPGGNVTGLANLQTELVVNLKTARALGLTIPPSVLHRADRVIE